jgi:hypothetical protein
MDKIHRLQEIGKYDRRRKYENNENTFHIATRDTIDRLEKSTRERDDRKRNREFELFKLDRTRIA